MKGGHANSGPMADPTALRRDRDARGFTVLPEEGRPGPPPPWPLIDPSERDLVLWAAEWSRPQATEWIRNRQEVEVAMYVRSLVAAEKLDASVASRTLVRQQSEALGITAPGMARLRWTIGHVAPAEVIPLPTGPSTRERFGRGGGEDFGA